MIESEHCKKTLCACAICGNAWVVNKPYKSLPIPRYKVTVSMDGLVSDYAVASRV